MKPCIYAFGYGCKRAAYYPNGWCGECLPIRARQPCNVCGVVDQTTEARELRDGALVWSCGAHKPDAMRAAQ